MFKLQIIQFTGILTRNDSSIAKALKVMKFTLEHQVIPCEYEDDKQMVTSEYRVQVKFEDIRVSYLLTALANQDFNRKPRVHGNLMLYNATKQILLYIYDDRGCDVWG